MPTAERFVKHLLEFDGITEDPPGSNRNKFAAIAGHANGQLWCATFLVAGAREVGLKFPNDSAYTPTLADGFRKAGRWSADGPVRGDLAFIDFPNDAKNRIQHVAVVVEVDGDSIRTIEGNTSSSNSGLQDNGGGVFRKRRPRKIVVGYGRPAFDPEPPTMGGGGVIVPKEDLEMAIVVSRPQGGYIVVESDGTVFNESPAPHHGSIADLQNVRLGGNIIGGAWTQSGDGYWLVARDGAIYTFGDAQFFGGFNMLPPEVRGNRFAVGMARTRENSYRVIAFDPSGNASRYDHYEFPIQ